MIRYVSIISSLLFIPSIILAEEFVISHTVPLSSLPDIASHSEKITLATSISKSNILGKLVDYLKNHPEIKSKNISEKELGGIAAGAFKIEIVKDSDETESRSLKAFVKPDENSDYIEKVILHLISDSPLRMKFQVNVNRRSLLLVEFNSIADRLSRLPDSPVHRAQGNKPIIHEYLKQIIRSLRAVVLEEKALRLWRDGLKKNREEIKDYLRQVIQLDPSYAGALIASGSLSNFMEDYQQAILDLTRAIDIDSEDHRAYINRGIAYRNTGQPDKALKDYNHAIQLNPKDAGVYNNRGNVYSQLGQDREALSDYNASIEINPNNPQSFYNRGKAWIRLERTAEAIEDFTKAISLDPAYMEAYINRGIIYGQSGKFKMAVEDLSRAINMGIRDARVYYNRGLSLYRMGKHRGAIDDYSRAIRLAPDYADAYINRGGAYGTLRKYSRAVEDLDKAISMNPDDPQAYLNRGLVYQEWKKYKKAVIDYTKVIELIPQNPFAYVNRGISYLLMGKRGPACADIRKACDLGKCDNLRMVQKKGFCK